MRSQSTGGNIRLVTTAANERSFIVVESLVEPQVDGLGETLTASVTGVGLLSLVESHVCFQIGIGAETFFALCALVWLLSCVDKFMLLQMSKLSESFLAAFKFTGIRSEP